MDNFGDMDYVEYYLDFVRRRITELRISKGVSEREMSLALGKGQSFINRLAAGKNAPLFENFFEICEYLGVTPEEFFDQGQDDPVVKERLYEEVGLRSGGDPQRFLNLLTKISPENFQAFLSMLENM